MTYESCLPITRMERGRENRVISYVVCKIPYRRAPRLALRPSASREQRYLAYNQLCFILQISYIAELESDVNSFTIDI